MDSDLTLFEVKPEGSWRRGAGSVLGRDTGISRPSLEDQLATASPARPRIAGGLGLGWWPTLSGWSLQS